MKPTTKTSTVEDVKKVQDMVDFYLKYEINYSYNYNRNDYTCTIHGLPRMAFEEIRQSSLDTEIKKSMCIKLGLSLYGKEFPCNDYYDDCYLFADLCDFVPKEYILKWLIDLLYYLIPDFLIDDEIYDKIIKRFSKEEEKEVLQNLFNRVISENSLWSFENIITDFITPKTGLTFSDNDLVRVLQDKYINEYEESTRIRFAQKIKDEKIREEQYYLILEKSFDSGDAAIINGKYESRNSSNFKLEKPEYQIRLEETLKEYLDSFLYAFAPLYSDEKLKKKFIDFLEKKDATCILDAFYKLYPKE